MKLCALSVDLDEIPCYHAIHGIPMPGDDTAHAVYAIAVRRYLDLLADLGVPCTFFVIGSDLDHHVSVEGATAIRDAGHELACHTYSHRYDLVRLGTTAIQSEVREGVAAITRATGVIPVGFRAPGYTITDEVFDVLIDAGFAYDSSVFPCPMYWSGKAAFIATTQALGRRSHSIVDTPAVLACSADPYVPGRPYWRRGQDEGLVELPIGVTRFARLPYIGTSVMLAGASRVDLLTAQIAGRPLVNLELHGLDLLEERDGLALLSAHQRDLKVSLQAKLSTLRRVVNDLRTRGYRFVTLKDAAETLRPTLRP